MSKSCVEYCVHKGEFARAGQETILSDLPPPAVVGRSAMANHPSDTVWHNKAFLRSLCKIKPGPRLRTNTGEKVPSRDLEIFGAELQFEKLCEVGNYRDSEHGSDEAQGAL